METGCTKGIESTEHIWISVNDKGVRVTCYCVVWYNKYTAYYCMSWEDLHVNLTQAYTVESQFFVSFSSFHKSIIGSDNDEWVLYVAYHVGEHKEKLSKHGPI